MHLPRLLTGPLTGTVVRCSMFGECAQDEECKHIPIRNITNKYKFNSCLCDPLCRSKTRLSSCLAAASSVVCGLLSSFISYSSCKIVLSTQHGCCIYIRRSCENITRGRNTHSPDVPTSAPKSVPRTLPRRESETGWTRAGRMARRLS